MTSMSEVKLEASFWLKGSKTRIANLSVRKRAESKAKSLVLWAHIGTKAPGTFQV